MTERTSSLCVSHAMQGFMQREVTVGTEERVINMNDGRDSRDSHFAKGRGRSNLYGSFVRATVPPLRVYFLRFWTGY